ncbi:hypothetical protein CAC42_1463 [Sphaceloma murrayae]|uniref:Uncharacterized protein n=1 Tax=Sphaceloma murrayae TaxID=2082308 RepID=A0A2K1QY83_9PEZI|nr:hypothetical protein CAC42_1463 [Sphaceloma murrayae]
MPGTLAFIASHHIEHNDIKLSNILIDAGEMKLIDLGMATSALQDRSAIGGTPAYVPPEVMIDEFEPGKRDVFALGIILLDMLKILERPKLTLNDRRVKKIDVGRAKNTSHPKDIIDLTGDDDPQMVRVQKKASGSRRRPSAGPSGVSEKAGKKQEDKAGKAHEEKRLARFRNTPPHRYWDYHHRATTQRMFVLDRTRPGTIPCPHAHPSCPSETLTVAGSTGNVYTVSITHVPRCTCPDFQKGNKQCKHIIYALVQVLKAPFHISYQLAFLTSELVEIFAHAGPLPVDTVGKGDRDGKRRPVEGDCPICCCELDEGAEEVVWCRAACGNNLHKSCFEQWAASRRGVEVTCPYCRTGWSEGGDLKELSRKGRVGREGYVNLAQELGLSGQRDYGSYHPFWVRGRLRDGMVDEGGEWEESY